MPTTSTRRATTPPLPGSKPAARTASWFVRYRLALIAVAVVALGVIALLATRGGGEQAHSQAEGAPPPGSRAATFTPLSLTPRPRDGSSWEATKPSLCPRTPA